MKNLGKIFLILFVIPYSVYAGVTASVDFNKVSVGEVVTYSLKISDVKIQRPLIDSLCGSKIVSSSSQTNIEMINGNYARTRVLNYKFMPRKTCKIEPLEILVDGKKQRTKAIEIQVAAPTKDVNADFVIDLNSSKKEMYVGEPFELTMLIKQKRTAQALDSKFIAPSMQGFWKKGEPRQEKYAEGAYMVTKLTYKLSAQREGSLEITPAQLAIATRSGGRDMWGSFGQDIRWKSYFSNSMKIEAKALPFGATLIGNLQINVSVDKNTINVNEAVNVTVEVRGEGNLEDIPNFKPFIQGVSVFDEKPFVGEKIFREKLALVGDADFVVPAFSLEVFNPQTKKIETIRSKEIPIKVNGATEHQALKIKRDETAPLSSVATSPKQCQESSSMAQMLLVFLIGLALGMSIMLYEPWKYFTREKSFDMSDEKKILVKLLPFKEEDEDVQKMIEVLEHNIYSNEKQKLDKKSLKELFKKYDLL